MFVMKRAMNLPDLAPTMMFSDSEEMTFAEFIECITAISCCRDSNPYVPISRKVINFLSAELLPKAVVKLRQISPFVPKAPA